jgi:hypothetical protein
MAITPAALKELHQLHLQLQEVREKLRRGPTQIAARRQFAEKKQAELVAEKARLLELRKHADGKSLQLKSNEAKIADLKGKLNAASSNREFDVIKGQIDADLMANSVLEDEILEAMEKIDAEALKLKALEEEVAAAQAAEKRVAAEIEAERPGLEVRAAELEKQVRAAESMLPGTVADVYRRLVQAHGAGALAGVTQRERACGSCNTTLSPQEIIQLNTQTIIFCRACGRMLYKAEG